VRTIILSLKFLVISDKKIIYLYRIDAEKKNVSDDIEPTFYDPSKTDRRCLFKIQCGKGQIINLNTLLFSFLINSYRNILYLIMQ